MANFKHSIDYKFNIKKCLIIYLLLVCVLIGARTSSRMVGQVAKNPATIQVAKPIMDLVVANNITSANIYQIKQLIINLMLIIFRDLLLQKQRFSSNLI